jgi:hypothetical protein
MWLHFQSAGGSNANNVVQHFNGTAVCKGVKRFNSGEMMRPTVVECEDMHQES